jgi:hypothetical protein
MIDGNSFTLGFILGMFFIWVVSMMSHWWFNRPGVK